LHFCRNLTFLRLLYGTPKKRSCKMAVLCSVKMETAKVKPPLWRLLARFDSWSDYVGFVVDKMTLGQVFSRFFDFLLPILISPTPTYSLIIRCFCLPSLPKDGDTKSSHSGLGQYTNPTLIRPHKCEWSVSIQFRVSFTLTSLHLQRYFQSRPLHYPYSSIFISCIFSYVPIIIRRL
jgi:hypothetical protein